MKSRLWKEIEDARRFSIPNPKSEINPLDLPNSSIVKEAVRYSFSFVWEAASSGGIVMNSFIKL